MNLLSILNPIKVDDLPSPDETGFLYRITDEWEDGRVRIRVNRYRVAKETPKGVWIHRCQFSSYPEDRKFVLRSGRRRFAYPTIDEAKVSFLARKDRQIRILNAQMDKAKEARDWVKGLI